MDSGEGTSRKPEKTPGNSGMEVLIQATNRMLDVCTQTGTSIQFDFPQIAVIGCQSAGKSSVMENFVGRDFLPRGTGMVTRRPLILQLINGPTEYGEFGHSKEKKFFNFNEIRNEIQTETERGVTNRKGVSEVPIILHIHSPNVLNLTLIDLPGITKVPIGDHPEDIEQQIRDMILKYIRNENCLILAVTPGNMDLANSDAMKLAREVDPDGLRTIGVITKLDLMDEGTDARDILENKLLPLKRGYIGIINRSQKNIDEKKDIAASLKSEREYFMNHKYYRTIINRMGTPYLQRVLNQQLTEHIREKLPNLQDKLRKQMVSLEKEVEQFNALHAQKLEEAENPDSMRPLIHAITKQLKEDFEKSMGGLGLNDIDTKKLSNGANINIIFHTFFPRGIADVSLDEAQMRHDINFAVRNIFGIKVFLFTPYMVFEALIRKQIERLKEPVLVCIDSVVEQLTSAVRACTQHIANYPNLREVIENKIICFIYDNGPKYKQSILSLIDMELAYMNIKHEEFLNNMKDTPSNSDAVHKKGGVIGLDASLVASVNKPEKIIKPETLSSSASDENHKTQNGTENGDVVYASFSAKISEDATKVLNGNSNGAGDDPKLTSDGVKTHENDHGEISKKNDEVDPAFDKEVGVIYEKLDSYMRIVKKTTRDMVPKAIYLYIVKQLEIYINDQLLIDLLAFPNDEFTKLFALSPLEAEKQKQKRETYEACREALDIIRDVSMDTVNGAIVDV